MLAIFKEKRCRAEKWNVEELDGGGSVPSCLHLPSPQLGCLSRGAESHLPGGMNSTRPEMPINWKGGGEYRDLEDQCQNP